MAVHSIKIIVCESNNIEESKVFKKLNKMDPKLEKTMTIFDSGVDVRGVKSFLLRMENTWIYNANNIDLLIKKIENMVLETLKFQLNSLYRDISQEYYRFSSIE